MPKALDTVSAVLCVKVEAELLKRVNLPLEQAKYRMIERTTKQQSLRGKQNLFTYLLWIREGLMEL